MSSSRVSCREIFCPLQSSADFGGCPAAVSVRVSCLALVASVLTYIVFVKISRFNMKSMNI